MLTGEAADALLQLADMQDTTSPAAAAAVAGDGAVAEPAAADDHQLPTTHITKRGPGRPRRQSTTASVAVAAPARGGHVHGCCHPALDLRDTVPAVCRVTQPTPVM